MKLEPQTFTFPPLTDQERCRIASGLNDLKELLEAIDKLGLLRNINNGVFSQQLVNRWHERMIQRLSGEASYEDIWVDPRVLPAFAAGFAQAELDSFQAQPY